MKKVNHKPSKRYQDVTAKVEPKKVYPLAEAVALAKDTSAVKFDASVELHIRLNIDPRKGDQQVRSTVALPHGSGKQQRIAVVTGDMDQQKAAKAAGADLIGDDVITDIKAGKINFDVLVATPDAMKLLAPVAKTLGPKGLMPNPKDGTVTTNVADAVASLKKGKVSYKNDDSANVHILIGKVSFSAEQLIDNAKAAIESVLKAKPNTVKGNYVKNMTLATSMGPGIMTQL